MGGLTATPTGVVVWDWLHEVMPYCCKVSLDGRNNTRFVQWAVEQFGPAFVDIASETWRWLGMPKPPKNEHDWCYYADDFFFNNLTDAIMFQIQWNAKLFEKGQK